MFTFCFSRLWVLRWFDSVVLINGLLLFDLLLFVFDWLVLIASGLLGVLLWWFCVCFGGLTMLMLCGLGWFAFYCSIVIVVMFESCCWLITVWWVCSTVLKFVLMMIWFGLFICLDCWVVCICLVFTFACVVVR